MKKAVLESVGNTPLIYLSRLSKITGNHIYGKAEFLNPGGSVKDRAAMGIILDAEKKGVLKTGYTIYEGTAGNTGIGLATLAAQRGYLVTIVMPNNQSLEKIQTLQALGVKLVLVDPCPFANQNHFYHTAKRLAEEDETGFWANQFENLANFSAHFSTTGPEIWEQSNKRIDYFLSAVGTGGTLGGVSKFLKQVAPNTKTILVDPFGSGLFNYFKNGELKSTGSSITEGIGIMRLTENFKQAQIDDSIQISDQQMIEMLYFLAKEEGLLVGTSAALNVRAAYELASQHKGAQKTFVTVLCDSGLRYQSKVFNPEWLAKNNLDPSKLPF